MVMKDVSDYENFFSLLPLLQRFLSLFILLSILLHRFFSVPETTPVYFCEYHEGGIQAASSYTAQKEKTKKEWLRGFRVFCSAFLSVEGDMGKEKWRIYTNTKSFSPPSAERAMACANRMRGKKRVQSKQTQSSQPKVK